MIAADMWAVVRELIRIVILVTEISFCYADLLSKNWRRIWALQAQKFSMKLSQEYGGNNGLLTQYIPGVAALIKLECIPIAMQENMNDKEHTWKIVLRIKH